MSGTIFMKTQKATILMAIIFSATQLITIAKGLITHSRPNELQKSYLIILLCIILAMGFVGAIAGFVYSKIFRFLPPYSLYLLTPAYLLFLSFLSFGWLQIQKNITLTESITVTTGSYPEAILLPILIGIIFSWTYQRKESQGTTQIK